MARITVEDCLTTETNRFGLVLLAAKRAKQLLHGGRQVIDDNRGNKAIVTSLREIATGKVRFMSEEDRRAFEEREAARLAEQGSAAPEATIAESVVAETPEVEGESRNGSAAGM